MENKAIEANSSLNLENQKRLTMTGVSAINSFSETSIKLTVAGKSALITGENIKITAYNKTSGNLQADGLITSIKFGYKKAPLIKRIFK